MHRRATDRTPFNLAISPAQRKQWQAGADALSRELGVTLSLSAYVRKRMDEAARMDILGTKK